MTKVSETQYFYCQSCCQPQLKKAKWVYLLGFRFDTEKCKEQFIEKHRDLIRDLLGELKTKKQSTKNIPFKIGLEYEIVYQPFTVDKSDSQAATRWVEDSYY